MALSAGMRVGPYEVIAPLGAGGMGEVYRARDTRLGRDVALKLLPDHLAHDAERLARFDREAKTLAALNHPHIAQVFGLENASGTPALVMELVEGPTLADRIAQGPIPLDEALPIARQIAEALEAAHEQHIVHRDLKPANIKVRPDGTVKVLDFGLAKAVGGEVAASTSETLANSPTITSPAMTVHGMILGTAAYMSPEQAKGKAVDRRADVWAFGCVLFEMLTGRRAFEGEDAGDTIAAVLRAEPAWVLLPAETPSRVRTLLTRCIERDLKKRLPHIGVARLDLEDGAATDMATMPAGQASLPPPRPSWRVHAAWAAVAATLAGGIALAPRAAPVAAPAPRTVSFEVKPPSGEVFPGANGLPRFALAPDGTKVVFAASSPGKYDRLYLRDLSGITATPIPGMELPPNGGDGMQQPFFSPDGRFVAFFSGEEGALKRVPAAGGPVERVASLLGSNFGGAWRGDVVLVATSATGGVMRVAAGGGALTQVTTIDRARGETAHLWPQFLPDGQHFLFLAVGPDPTVFVGSLSGAAPVRLVKTPAEAFVVPPNLVLFVRDDDLVAQPIDLERLALSGEAVLVAKSPLIAANSRVAVATSDAGVLAVAGGPSYGGQYEVRRLDRTGQQLGTGPIESESYSFYGRLSPDGSLLAYSRLITPGSADVWTTDLRRNIRTRVTSAAGADRYPLWSPDGRRLVFQASRRADGLTALYERDAAALTPEHLLLTAEPGHQVSAEAWSPDGKTLLVKDLQSGGSFGRVDLLRLSLGDTPGLSPYIADGFANRQAAFSPDGRWVAYSTNETGQPQVVLRSFPDPGVARVVVSSGGGSHPRWRADGRELYYVDSRNRVIAVPVTLGSSPVLGPPVELFLFPTPVSLNTGSGFGGPIDAFPDGQQFVVVTPRQFESGVSLAVTVNWTPGSTK